MKKVLFVTNSKLKDSKRGTPLRIVNFIKQIRRENDVVVCADSFDDNDEIVFLKYPSELGTIKKLFYFINFIKKNKIDLVFTVTEIGIRLPVLIRVFTCVKILIDLHGLYYEELFYAKKISKAKKIIKEYEVKLLLPFYDKIFVVSEKLKKYYQKNEKKIVVISGGANINKFKNNTIVKKSNIVTIGYMGNTRLYQGLNLLLKALENIKKENKFDFKLNLVLSGEIDYVFKKLKKINIFEDSIINCNVSHEEVYDIILVSDVLIIPRPKIKMTEYAFPSKFPEYLLTGVPVIVTDVGPIKNVVRGQKICFIVDTDDIVKNIEKALLKFKGLSVDERERMGKRAREFVENNLTWNKMGDIVNKNINNL